MGFLGLGEWNLSSRRRGPQRFGIGRAFVFFLDRFSNDSKVASGVAHPEVLSRMVPLWSYVGSFRTRA